jgi:signal transduction histidine kinase
LETARGYLGRVVPRRYDMSLKTRLRLFVTVLMISVVTALSLLHLYTLGKNAFDDPKQRAVNTAQLVSSFVRQRLAELVRELPRARRSEDAKKLYSELLQRDAELSEFLQTTALGPIVEISVSDASGRIVADSLGRLRIGRQAPKLPAFETWVAKSPWRKLSDVFTQSRDYGVTASLGIAGTPLFDINVVLTSAFLRNSILPQVQSVALIFLVSLLASMLLAVAVSNLVLRPLDNISKAIDRISRGDFAKAWIPDGAAKEFAAVQSKLNLLGQQYHGARQDAIQLRSNVEQLLERLEEVVLLFDRDDRLVMAGRAAERILGRGRWEILGRPLNELFPPVSALGAAIRNVIELRQPLKDLHLALERDGAPQARVLVNIEILESFPDHQRIGTLLTLRDAETRRQIQSQLDVSARLAAISRLTGGVAHEIKNPLQAITVHLEVLKSKLADQFDYVGPEIETIAREILRLDRVVKTFLDFTRPVDVKMCDLEMTALVRDVVALVGPSAGRQNVRIELDAEPGEISIHGDRDLLQQAILNVIVNGVEAMKSGGGLRIQVRRDGDECCVNIADEGAGIPPEIREKIFNLYFSTKGKGSGIGLAMTFRVVQLHNGTIDFASQPGKGTTFRLRFPAIYGEPLRGTTPVVDEQAPSR